MFKNVKIMYFHRGQGTISMQINQGLDKALYNGSVGPHNIPYIEDPESLDKSPLIIVAPIIKTNILKKSRIRETLNLLTDAESSSDTIFFAVQFCF